MNPSPNTSPKPSSAPPSGTPAFSWRFLGPRYWVQWLGFALLWLLAFLPARWRVALAKFVGGQIYQRNDKRREIALTNIEWCLPELEPGQREALAKQSFQYMAQSVLDVGIFLWGSLSKLNQSIELRGEDELTAWLESGRRVILLTCHTPFMDRGGLLLSSRYPFESMANTLRNPLQDWMLSRRRSRFGGLVYPRNAGLRPLIKGLRQGYALYILTDEDLGAEGAVFVPFFGVPRATLTTPTRLARMCNADIFTAITWYDEERNRYVVDVSRALDNLPSGDDAVDAATLNQIIEKMVREHPAQYMWSLRLFQTMPDGSAPPYRMQGNPASGHRPRPEGVGE